MAKELKISSSLITVCVSVLMSLEELHSQTIQEKILFTVIAVAAVLVARKCKRSLQIQPHEKDHLDGVLFPDRLSSLLAFGFTDELQAHGRIP